MRQKKYKAPKADIDRPYHVQLGRARVGSMTSNYDTEARARAHMLRQAQMLDDVLERLIPDPTARMQHPQCQAVQRLRGYIGSATFELEAQAIEVEVPGMVTIYIEYWRDPSSAVVCRVGK